MRRFLIVAFLLLTMMAVGHLEIVAKNRRTISTYHEQLVDYGRLESDSKAGQSSSLGAYIDDGGSPGYIIGRSWKDDQNHLNTGRMIDWGVNPQIHFIFCNQVCGGLYNPGTCARWIHYNMFDPTFSPGGVFISGANGLPLQASPFIESGMYPNLAVDENGRMIGVAEAQTPSSGVRWTRLWWDLSSSGWGTFLSDSIPDQNVGTGFAENRHYPIVEYQEFGGQYVTHVIALNGIDPTDAADKLVAYWRKVNSASGLGGSWTMTLIADGPWSDTYDMAVARDGSGKAAIAWCQERDESTVLGSAIWLITSADAGATWTSAVDIVPFIFWAPSWQAWNECSVILDSDNFVHVVYNTTFYDGSGAGGVDPSRIIHWTDRVTGPDAGGQTSLVQSLDFNGFADMCGQFGHNMLNNGMVILSECNDRLYTIWTQAGDPDIGDLTDCVDENTGPAFLGAYNGDLHMSVSMTLDGSLWDARRNLTQSKTPLCDGTDGNACDHDAWPTMSRFGMDNRASVIGANYWSSAPEAFEVRDMLDASYPDFGFFLDVQFVNDLLPESAMFLGSEYWTNNPIKWFRLPCVDPIVEPRILILTDDMLHPISWVESGSAHTYHIKVANIGNKVLNIHTIIGREEQGSGWLQIINTSLTLDAATEDFVFITLNVGAIVTPPGTAVAIEGYVIFKSDDPNNPRDSLYINTVIADNVIQVAHEVIRTGRAVPMGPINIGTAANYPNTGGYMQYYEKGGIQLDCDSQEVYLYDMTPVVMTDASTGWWAPYYDARNPDSNNFVPIPGDQLTEFCSGNTMKQFLTGDFVTSDSAIGMNKAWAAPNNWVQFVIERWQIFSRNGLIHTGVQLGEYLDIDVPSDTNVNNHGVIVEADDYIWMTGQETDDESCEQNDLRFYAAGLLGYYYTSEYLADDQVNHTGLAGAYVVIHPTLMDDNYEFVPDSLWEYMTKKQFLADNSTWDDQRAFLAYGGFDIKPNDTLVIWTVHGSLLGAGESFVADQIAKAKVWYMAHRGEIGLCGCCGQFTEGFPGNTNCDEAGKRNLADITKLIDHVYISKLDLCCMENGNVNGDDQGKRNLADITKLIDHVYISKAEVPPCL